MSDESLSGLDEGALRKLLEVTLDLAERRRIRSAIRELQRQELERDEEALASKRFRSERQENKENWLHSQQQEEEQRAALAALSRKLESISDVEELTTLLRGAGEYEERKLIRAAIRRVRAQEIEEATLAGRLCSRGESETRAARGTARGRERKASSSEEREEPVEQEQIGIRVQVQVQVQELHSERQEEESSGPDSNDMASGTLLILDPPGPQPPSLPTPPSTPSSPEPPQNQDGAGSGDSVPDEAEELIGKRPSSPTWKEPQPQSSFRSVSPSEQDGEEDACPAAAPGSLEPVAGLMKERGPKDPPTQRPSNADQNSELLPGHRDQAAEKTVTVPERRRAEPLRDIPSLTRPLSHRFCERSLSLRIPRTAQATESPGAGPAGSSPFQRANSVRDRARKFTSEAPTPPPLGPGQRGISTPRGPRILQQRLLTPGPGEWTQGGTRGTPSSLRGKPEGGAHPARAAEPPGNAQGGLTGSVRGRPSPRGEPGTPGSAPSSRGTGGSRSRSGSSSSRQGESGFARAGAEESGCPKEEAPVGRSLLTSQGRPLENGERGPCPSSEEPSSLPSTAGSSQDSCAREPYSGATESNMKTTFTIEIKDGRSHPISSRVVGPTGNQRAELTLGLRGGPIHFTSSSSSSSSSLGPTSHTSIPVSLGHASGTSGTRTHISSINSVTHISRTGEVNKMDPEPEEPPAVEETEVANGTEKGRPAKEPDTRGKLSSKELNAIEDESILDKMLDQTTDFEERRLIRAALRELRQKKRDQRDKEREQRLQEVKHRSGEGRGSHATETTTRQSQKSADGSAVSTITKTERLVHSNDGSKTSRVTTVESSYVKRSENGGGSSSFVQTKSFSSSSKKMGSIFDREDNSPSRAGSLAALERRQAEKKKELMKAQSLPKTSASQARKAMIEKLEKESGSPAGPRVTVQRSTSFGVPNANSIKQMLLDWCRAKTRGYEHVDIQNFSSSWSDGMAFCALVHNFFPEAFDYAQLTPQNRRQNFEVAFSSAETHADCPQLLDTEDMVRMREPDWKCVYTYIQEFYRCLVQKGLVKTKKS
ncbi:smoothelin isoform X2 [Ornithorhynchus anatinus]|uniref:smoothelin isoform X2 n=1 Tax=Ornithorhynchus anatinus TaxID=9258 RepID=UPI0010A80C48|nr:smoothelin isoform X2 [Ornithorhynchus anatinus]